MYNKNIICMLNANITFKFEIFNFGMLLEL